VNGVKTKTLKPAEAIQGIFHLLNIKDGFHDRDFKTPDVPPILAKLV